MSLGSIEHARHRALRVSGADAVAGDARHDADDLGQRPDRRSMSASSCRAWRSTSSPPSSATSLRSTEAGLKYFVLGALSSGMLLYGASLIYGFAGTHGLRADRRGAARPGSGGRDRPHHRHRLRGRGPRLQGLRRAVPHVDARRLRGRADAGHRLLRRRAQDRRHRRCSSAS